MAKQKTPTVFVVSDSRGETAQQLVKAAAVQFEGVRYRTVRRSNVRTPAQAEKVVEQAAKIGAVIFYTLVTDDVRKTLRRSAREQHVPSVDILGPAFTALHDLFHRKRSSEPGLLYALDRERIDRMDAIDYTLKHDDGQRPHELADADVVLVGVSRSSKSTTCFYLGYEGIRAANVPLIPDIPPAPQLLELPSNKVIGLRVQLARLLTVREGRARNLRIDVSDPYTDKRSVGREINSASRMMEQHEWRSVDVSYLAVEEIARDVMRLISRS
jgi:regulator of PEP synthase PpsR (kinase-PPPase family)